MTDTKTVAKRAMASAMMKEICNRVSIRGEMVNGKYILRINSPLMDETQIIKCVDRDDATEAAFEVYSFWRNHGHKVNLMLK